VAEWFKAPILKDGRSCVVASPPITSRQVFSVVLPTRGPVTHTESRPVFACLGPMLGPNIHPDHTIPVGSQPRRLL
jgi:hypothetical protein